MTISELTIDDTAVSALAEANSGLVVEDTRPLHSS